jgi:hypothetical protein
MRIRRQSSGAALAHGKLTVFYVENTAERATVALGGQALVEKLFRPLGYDAAVTRHPLDARFPTWRVAEAASRRGAGVRAPQVPAVRDQATRAPVARLRRNSS